MKRAVAAICVVAAVAGLVWWWQSPASEPSEEPEPTRASAAERADPVLEGMVTDASGEPVEGATVVVSRDETEDRATTDESGEFAIRELAAGNYKLDIRADGFIPPGPPPIRRLEIRVPEAGSANAPNRLQLTVYRPASIEGRVVAGSEPVDGASVAINYEYPFGYRSGGDPYVRSGLAETGADGSFRLDAVPPGRLRIVARSDRRGSRRSRELLVESGESVDGIVLDLEPQGAVAGKVVTSKGTPVRASLTVTGDALKDDRQTRSSEDGNFRIEGLPAGDYRLTARADGYRTRTYDVSVERNEITNRAVTLRSGEGLYGRVVNPEGEGVEGALVRFRAEGRSVWRRTSQDGRFQWKKAPDKQWTVRAYSPRYGPSSSSTAQPGRAVELTLGAGGYIQGRVLAPDGTTVSGAKVGVTGILVEGPQPYGSSAAGFETVESGDGTFRFGPLRPGRYRLEAKKSGYANGRSPQVVVEADETTRQIDIRLGTGGRVTGIVRSKKSGDPIEGATVSTYDMGSAFESREGRTDERGRFTLKRVPSGRRSLRIRHSDHLTRFVSGLQVPAGGTLQRNITLREKKEGQDFAFRGIGASLQRTDGGVEISRVLPGGGAEKNGLKQGDVIRSVDRESVDDLPLSRVVQRIRGRAGEPVQLTVERDGRGKFEVEIERGRVVVD